MGDTMNKEAGRCAAADCKEDARDDSSYCSPLCERVVAILAVRLSHWTEPPSSDAQLETYYQAQGTVLGGQNVAGGRGGGFDPNASDTRLVGKLIRNESVEYDEIDELREDGDPRKISAGDARAFKLVGKRLIGVGHWDKKTQRMVGERSPMMKFRETDQLLAQLSPFERIVLRLAFDPVCPVPTFAAKLRDSAQARAAADDATKLPWGKRGPPRRLAVTVLTETAYLRWHVAGSPRSMPEWILTHQGALRDSLAEAAALVFVAHNRWRDLRGRRVRVERHASEEEASRAIERDARG